MRAYGKIGMLYQRYIISEVRMGAAIRPTGSEVVVTLWSSVCSNKMADMGAVHFVLQNGRYWGRHFVLQNGRHGARHFLFANGRDRLTNKMVVPMSAILLNQPEVAVSLHVMHGYE